MREPAWAVYKYLDLGTAYMIADGSTSETLVRETGRYEKLGTYSRAEALAMVRLINSEDGEVYE